MDRTREHKIEIIVRTRLPWGRVLAAHMGEHRLPKMDHVWKVGGYGAVDVVKATRKNGWTTRGRWHHHFGAHGRLRISASERGKMWHVLSKAEEADTVLVAPRVTAKSFCHDGSGWWTPFWLHRG